MLQRKKVALIYFQNHIFVSALWRERDTSCSVDASIKKDLKWPSTFNWNNILYCSLAKNRKQAAKKPI
jgi:hypothetical protein